MKIPVVKKILEANDRIADQLKRILQEKKILTLNLMSSPGAGKTTLLEKTLTELKESFNMAVVEGDLQTSNDAERVAATGAQAIQINTEGGCHLDSSMVLDAVGQLNMDDVDILFIENVGNLVCPAEFNVGEDHKITLLSVTEGDDKPEKYPYMFAQSSVVLLNKIDLLPYVDFDMEKASRISRNLNKDLEILPVSCRTGEGLNLWYAWLEKEVARKKNV